MTDQEQEQDRTKFLHSEMAGFHQIAQDYADQHNVPLDVALGLLSIATVDGLGYMLADTNEALSALNASALRQRVGWTPVDAIATKPVAGGAN